MVNILSRVYNSTLGVPQQFLYRTIRALKDDDVDLFSREGLLAPELLPVLGTFFSHESDATIEDIVGEDAHWLGRLALDIAADPATYLTAGVTGFAKSAKTVRAGIQGKARQEIVDAGIDLGAFKTSGELRAALNEAIDSGKIKNRRSKRAAAELSKLDEKTKVSDILSESADVSELLISIPGLARWGAERKAPEIVQGHKSWFGFLNHVVYGKAFNAAKGSEQGKAVARKLGDAVRAADKGQGGFATQALNAIYKIPAAVKVLKESSKDLLPVLGAESPEFTRSVAEAAKFRSKHGHVVDRINLETLGADVDRIRKNISVRTKFLENQKQRFRNNPERLKLIAKQEQEILEYSFRNTTLPRELKELFIEQWRGLMRGGVPGPSASLDAPMDFAQMVGRNAELLKKESAKADKLLSDAKVKFEGFKNKRRDELLGEDPHWITKFAYDVGQVKAKTFEFMFGTNKKINAKFIEMAETRARTADASIQRTLEANQHRLIQTLKRVSADSGVPEEEINKILNISAEGTALPADFAANMAVLRSANSTVEQVTSAAKNVRDWLNKQRLALEVLGMHTQLDKRATAFLDNLSNKQINILTDAGRHWDEAEHFVLSESLLPDHLMGFKNKRLRELSDKELLMLSRGTDDVNRVKDPMIVGKIRRLLQHRKATKGQMVRPDGVKEPLAFKDVDDVVVHRPVSQLTDAEIAETLKREDLTADQKRRIRKAHKNFKKSTPVGKADEVLVPENLGSLTPEMQAYVDMRLALDDIENGRFSSMTILRLERGHNQLGSMARENALKAFKGADKKDVEALFGVSEEAARIAHSYNGFSFGVPLGFLPRFKNPEIESRLTKLFGDVEAVVGTPDAANLNRRFRDRDILLDDLNAKLDDIADSNEASREIISEIKSTLKDNGLGTGKGRLADDHLDIMFTSMGRDLAQMNAAKLINETFNHSEAIRYGMVGGKVVDVLDGNKKSIKHRHTRKFINSKKDDIEEVIKEGETDTTAAYAVIRRDDGHEAVIDLTDSASILGQSVQEGLVVRRLGEGETLGNAFIASNLRAGSQPLGELMVGEYLAMGGKDVMAGFDSAWTPNKAFMQKGLSAYDRANFLVKRFQTILRPAHHIANQISGFFQSSAAGASAEAIAEAWVDVSLMMYGTGTSRMRREFQEQVIGRSGLQVTNDYNPRTAQYIQALAGNRSADDLLDEGIGQLTTPRGVIEHGDVWQSAVDEGLLYGTFAHQELVLGAGGSLTRTQEARKRMGIRYADDKTRVEKITQGWDELGDTAQTLEIHARMATVYSLIYDGHTLDDAIQLAKQAHVDYSSLGFGERGILKRAIPYYTFSRKYVPWALGRMAKSPAGASVTIKAIEQSGVMGVDPDGKVVFNQGAFEMDLGRANANIDALMTVASLADMLSGSFTVEGQQSLKQPGMLAVAGGGVPGIIAEGLGIGTDENLSAKNAFGAMMDATFVGRLIERSVQAAEERSTDPLLDWSLNYLLPAKFTEEPKKAVKFAISSAERSLRRLEAQFKKAGSQSEKKRILEQANKIKNAIQTTVEDFS